MLDYMPDKTACVITEVVLGCNFHNDVIITPSPQKIRRLEAKTQNSF